MSKMGKVALGQRWHIGVVSPRYQDDRIVNWTCDAFGGKGECEKFTEDTCAKAHDVAARFCELKNAKAESKLILAAKERLRTHYIPWSESEKSAYLMGVKFAEGKVEVEGPREAKERFSDLCLATLTLEEAFMLGAGLVWSQGEWRR